VRKETQIAHSTLMKDLCEKGNLREYASANHSKTFVWFVMVRRFLAEIICALQSLHNNKGVVYRDLKLSKAFVVAPLPFCT